MIKKHQKRLIYVPYQRTFLKQLLKKTFKLAKENSNIEENLCLIDKLLMLFNYWSNQMEKLIAAVKFVLLT